MGLLIYLHLTLSFKIHSTVETKHVFHIRVYHRRSHDYIYRGDYFCYNILGTEYLNDGIGLDNKHRKCCTTNGYIWCQDDSNNGPSQYPYSDYPNGGE